MPIYHVLHTIKRFEFLDMEVEADSAREAVEKAKATHTTADYEPGEVCEEDEWESYLCEEND